MPLDPTEYDRISSVDGSIIRFVIPYDEFDVMLKDIDEEELEMIGRREETGHLSEGTFSSPPFPVSGILHGPNMRFMISLVVQPDGEPNFKPLNIWFLVNTSSPFTTLTVKSLEAFYGAGNVREGGYYRMRIQDPNACIDCKVSKAGSNFEFVNILGINAFRQLSIRSIDQINWQTSTFCLTKQ